MVENIFSGSNQTVSEYFEGTVTGSGNTFLKHGKVVDKGNGNRFSNPMAVEKEEGGAQLYNSRLPAGMKATLHRG